MLVPTADLLPRRPLLGFGLRDGVGLRRDLVDEGRPGDVRGGRDNPLKPNTASVEVLSDPELRLLSTNGPQGVDALAEAIAVSTSTPAGA